MATSFRKTLVEILEVFTSGLTGIIFPLSGIEVKLSSAVADTIVDVIKDRFGISEEQQDDVRQRAERASHYLTNAGKILTELQSDLQRKNRELESLISVISERQKEAEHWSKLASIDKELASSLTTEIESRLRGQIQTELNRNKIKRRVFAIILWVITLIGGAIVGVALQEYWNDFKKDPVVEPIKIGRAP